MKTFVIGRSSFADIIIADASVAPHHAELVVTMDGRLHLTDCHSETGTWRAGPDGEEGNGRDVWQSIRQDFVRADERLRLGDHVCTARDLLHAVINRQTGGEHVIAGRTDRPDRPRGRVERDARTGEIVRKRP